MPKYHCFFAHYQPLKNLKWAQNWAALKTWAQVRAKIERERKFSGWARVRAHSNFLSALKLSKIEFSRIFSNTLRSKLIDQLRLKSYQRKRCIYRLKTFSYSFVSNKRRVANKRRVWKKYQNEGTLLNNRDSNKKKRLGLWLVPSPLKAHIF